MVSFRQIYRKEGETVAIIPVIKFDGDSKTLAWKHPNDELTTSTRLMVNDSQQAVLFKDGVPCDVFDGGTYVLETRNIPFLQRLINLPSGGESRFRAEVWYINKAAHLDVKWGTPSPMQLLDPLFQVMIPVRANGQFGIRVSDASAFLKTLVGTRKTFSTDDVIEYFKGLYLMHVKDAISGYIVNKGISVTQISANLSELSAHVELVSREIMARYGLELISFYINSVSVDQSDPVVAEVQKVLVERFRQNQLSYTYQEQQKLKALNAMAANPGSPAGDAAKIASLFTAVEVGRELAQELKPDAAGRFCPQCGAKCETDFLFCPKCGNKL